MLGNFFTNTFGFKYVSQDQSIQLIHGDILREDVSLLITDLRNRRDARSSGSIAPNDKPQMIANLPYNITKDFLNKALPLGDEVSSLLLMLQHEVAVRLVENSPGTSDWRSMNVIVDYFCEAEYIFRVDRFKYTPVPKVDGAVVLFKLRPSDKRLQVPSEKDFLALVKRAFLQRRKMLTNALQPLLSSSEIADCLTEANLSTDSRAQNLSVSDFVELAWAIHRKHKTK